MSCAVFVIITLFSYNLIYSKKNTTSPTNIKIRSTLPVAALCIWMVLFYINELKAEHPLDGDVIRHNFPFLLWITLMLIGTSICLFILRKDPSEKTLKIRKRIRAFVTLLFTIGTSVQFYAPNIF